MVIHFINSDVMHLYTGIEYVMNPSPCAEQINNEDAHFVAGCACYRTIPSSATSSTLHSLSGISNFDIFVLMITLDLHPTFGKIHVSSDRCHITNEMCFCTLFDQIPLNRNSDLQDKALGTKMLLLHMLNWSFRLTSFEFYACLTHSGRRHPNQTSSTG